MGIMVGFVGILLVVAVVVEVQRNPLLGGRSLEPFVDLADPLDPDAVPPEDMPPEIAYTLLPHHPGGIDPNASAV
ncbi:hypothetical protein [Antrihabitans spumae]|uniref:Uncharacterized protein n=1 Tax=Antrihabitans spumae TaxID=3373370 RepID=A0ABW7KG14_9NOCA